MKITLIENRPNPHEGLSKKEREKCDFFLEITKNRNNKPFAWSQIDDYNETYYSCLIDEVHTWFTDLRISYSIDTHMTNDGCFHSYSIDIPDDDAALLFKLTWF
jgi:hypothetical protein